MPTLQVEAIGEEEEATEMLSREALFRNSTHDRAERRQTKKTISVGPTRQLPPGTMEVMREAAKQVDEEVSAQGSWPHLEDVERTSEMNLEQILRREQRFQRRSAPPSPPYAEDPSQVEQTLETTMVRRPRSQPRLFELDAELDQEFRVSIPLDLAAYLRLRPGDRVVIFLQSDEEK